MLSVRSIALPHALVLALEGELDLATAPEVDQVATTVPDARLVVVDARDVTFIDSSGLSCLLTLHRARPAGIVLVPGPRVASLLAQSGMCDAFCRSAGTGPGEVAAALAGCAAAT